MAMIFVHWTTDGKIQMQEIPRVIFISGVSSGLYTSELSLCGNVVMDAVFGRKKENELKHQGRFLLHGQPLGQTDSTWYNTAGRN